MAKLAITGAGILDPEREPGEGTLLVEDGRIVERLDAPAGAGEAAGADGLAGSVGPPIASDWRRVALDGRWLAPGFLDLHFHGELACAPAAAFPAALERAARQMLREGTTGFLATTVTEAREDLAPTVGALAAAIAGLPPAGAGCLGLHLEGPWISPEAPGAMAPEGIRPFDPSTDCSLLDRAGGLLRMVTLAPEMPGSAALLRELASRGAVAALGHTRAAPEVIRDAIAGGLRHVTHLFNAMGPLHHRDPGVSGTVLIEDRLTCDLICDGHHVHPSLVCLAVRALRDRLVLISDRVDPPGSGAATGPIDTALGRVFAGAAGEPWRRADGTIAGSRLSLDRAVRNVRAYADVELREAVAACTLRPARLLGIERERGTLRPGARADLAVLDAGGRVVETWLAGRRVWSVSAAGSGA